MLPYGPVEHYFIQGNPILVKREDLCCPPPGPSFSKMRGVLPHIAARPEEVIGVLDTYHSKAGWAVAWTCSQLGKLCVNFWPRYKADPPGLPRFQQQRAEAIGADLIALPAGRSAILYHQAKKELAARYPGAYMMPNALKLPESVAENAEEVLRTDLPPAGTIVISISSGTVAAGVIRGLAAKGLLPAYRIVLHMGYSRSREAVIAYIEQTSGVSFSDCAGVDLIDEGYGYADKAPRWANPPFPCNQYYDRKAWAWLELNHKDLPGPIVFWNIGD
jgi:hypothetical protein